MLNKQAIGPEDTAARVALWRALHVEQDPLPHVFVDDVGLRLLAPDAGWQNRPDMSPFTRPFRAGFKDAQHVSAASLAERYFSGRTDGLRPPSNCEEILVAGA